MLQEKLRQFRKAKGWTQGDLAELSGYSRNSIINWETGKRAPRTVDIDKLAFVLGVTPHDLIDNGVSNSNASSEKVQTFSNNVDDMNFMDFAYWGGVLDRAKKLASSKKFQEINLITPLLRSALEVLLSVQNEEVNEDVPAASGVSAYNGNHSSYNGNSLRVVKATA